MGKRSVAGGLPPGVSLITTSTSSFPDHSRTGDKVALAARAFIFSRRSPGRHRGRMTNERLEEQLRLLIGVWGSLGWRSKPGLQRPSAIAATKSVYLSAARRRRRFGSTVAP